jgi:hypothetical protein
MNNILNRKHKLLSTIGLLCFVVLVSCSDWDDFKKYTDEGEIIYPGKFDSVAVFSGDNRVRLWGQMTADPKVTSAKIFWNNNQDSAEFAIDGAGADYVFDQIIDIAEGVNSFTLYTYDAAGNKSVPAIVTGVAFGDRYRNTLYNRGIKSIAYDDAVTTIYWDIIDTRLGPEEMEVRYTNVDGEEVIVTTAASETSTALPNLNYGEDGFTWRTIYRPLAELTPIDTFATAYSARGVPTFAEEELDRSLFAEAFFTGDTFGNGGAGGIDAMWDEQAQNSYGGANFTDINSAWSSPQMITFDLGLKVDVTQIKIYPFQEWWGSYYVFSTIRDYEIYGSASPSSSGALDETWTLLASGTFAKPSGLGKDNESDADKALAIGGFPVTVDPDAPKVRYIRIRCLKNYEAYWQNGTSGFFSIAEIKISGMLPQ